MMHLYQMILCFVVAVCKRDDSVLFVLCRNEDLKEIKESIISLERSFNDRYNYPYVFLNDKPWDKEFMDEITKVVSSDVTFDIIKPEDWEMPANIDMEKAKIGWERMKKDKVPYADMMSYHNMCRFYAKAFYNQDVVKKYKYYWRLEPGVHFHCKLDFDPFEEMEENGWKYGFNITIYEYMSSIPTLGKVTQEFVKEYPELITEDSDRLKFIFDAQGNYNGCHFWTNFEIGSFEWLRSHRYRKYMEYLEKHGGFYYERWGDAPIRTLAAAMFLSKKEVHHFDKIGYTHPPFTHCPQNGKDCTCKVAKSIANSPGSCLPKYLTDQIISKLY